MRKGFASLVAQADEPLGGGRLRGADGTVHAKTGTGNAIQSHRIPDNVFRIMRHKGGLGAAGSHPAVFPVALVEAVLTAFSDPGDLIYEPFCGSGTQLVAAERAGRAASRWSWTRSIAMWPCEGGRWRQDGRRRTDETTQIGLLRACAQKCACLRLAIAFGETVCDLVNTFTKLWNR